MRGPRVQVQFQPRWFSSGRHWCVRPEVTSLVIVAADSSNSNAVLFWFLFSSWMISAACSILHSHVYTQWCAHVQYFHHLSLWPFPMCNSVSPATEWFCFLEEQFSPYVFSNTCSLCKKTFLFFIYVIEIICYLICWHF